ncbi:exodeoxyribonuclease V subunit beta [Candidatus Pantoea persica]|uniref:exodeoxyribonuclease V subunit beta n=1 Tax=Candidatus Pantoea persica TaxID=2518128 RepID=UPI00215D7ED2|nr:exodeoxyribonuclease V subunit beta [Candidatus Pantoea persica]MBA2815540.1 Exodeoxyribonuclease V beta chain [Candidatus Pantoea persica]
MSYPESLNPLTLPLRGERLIEASAGTGKTFTIGVLYLRLLLGLGGDKAYSRPLSVEEILVVTFTEAATAELRGRIRENIHELRLACVRGVSGSPMLAQLLAQIDDLPQAASLLLAAERQMDEAAIFTIHGFCQRMLNLNAFESGMLFEQELIEDEAALFKQAAADFWRRHCYPLTLEVARAIIAEWNGPESLLITLRPWLQGESPRLKRPPADDETLATRHAANLARIRALKQQWKAVSDEVEGIVSQSGVDKRSYSSKYLPLWVAKVTQWANSETTDYLFPKELERFAQRALLEKTKKGEPPRHPLFEAVEAFLAEPLSLRDLVIARALVEVRDAVRKEKRLRALLGFDDLLSRLDEALQQPGGALLADTIRSRFPVALIDEFQDTDPQQYRIFRTLYLNQPELALLLIGDPKQAIYAFRGADIFTYLRARGEISTHYTLDTNWRSSPGMVQSVNRLFARMASPFLFSAIPFLLVSPAEPNQQLTLLKEGQPQPALSFWLQPGDGVGVSDYQQFMAQQCAADISRWLVAGQQGRALLGKGESLRPVQASDITVLVRSRNEAGLIRDALNGLSIPSVYLSNRDSVYTTPEARELLWLLQAVQAPEQERLLRSALATSIFAIDAAALDTLSQNEREWDELVEQFVAWQQLWHQHGVLPMLRDVMNQRQLAENMLASENGERRLTDLMHLGELLQEASTQLDSPHALVRYLAQQIARPNSQSADQQLRLESDRHLVQIVTIHKSKGLQYPLVWLPFAAGFREAASALYHDRESFATLLDVQEDEQSMALAEQERLAEDLRLLYVALTRSVFHCSVGIAPLFKGARKKEGDSDLHKSALGYLVQQGESGDAARLRAGLAALADGDTEVMEEALIPGENWREQTPPDDALSSRHVSRDLRDFWRVTSYSGLQQHNSSPLLEAMPTFDIDAAGEEGGEAESVLTPHHFPRGAAPGTFLHGLFESIDFTRPPDRALLETQLEQNCYPPHWLPVLEAWIARVLHTPLNRDGLALGALQNGNRLVEMAFYLPLERPLSAVDLDALIRQHDALSARAPRLEFQQVRGMLKGFIDLVFRWNGQYYLLDYKSNWLGDSEAAYTPEAMAQAMVDHRYDLQYQLYTLALHRYLQHRLPGYDYQRHFGGVFYLFLRGVDGSSPENGIFTARPPAAFVAGLDALFRRSGEEGV